MSRFIMFAFLVAALWAPAPAGAQTRVAARAEQPTIIVAIMGDRKCGPCRVMAPKLDKAEKELASKEIMFVRFEGGLFSGGKDRKEAEALGIVDIYDRYKDKAGAVYVLDMRHQEVLESMNAMYQEDDIRNSIREGLLIAKKN